MLPRHLALAGVASRIAATPNRATAAAAATAKFLHAISFSLACLNGHVPPATACRGWRRSAPSAVPCLILRPAQALTRPVALRGPAVHDAAGSTTTGL